VNKLSTLLSNNNQIQTNQIGIYKFKCNDCPKIYVGESGRDISVRAQEHLNDIRNQRITSGPYSHIQDNPSHSFSEDNISLIEEERSKFARKFKESLYILKSAEYNCNQEEGIKISPIWTTALLKNFACP